jgi:coniferyl-aldehyde dehydrogenase
VCVGPDYVLVHEPLREALVSELVAATARMFPHMHGNPDYTDIATDAHRQHLRGLLADARDKGARELVINPANEPLEVSGSGKILPRLLFDVGDDMAVMQQEIFGPILPVLGYERIDEALDYVNARPRPLALYYFGHDAREARRVIDGTVSGGVTVNDVLLHAAQEQVPFGGVGASGFGQYRGFDGFREFSTPQAVLRQSRLNLVWGLLRPPYTPFKLRALRTLVSR